MVEVYKTNIKKQKQAKLVLKNLKKKFPHFLINFDLEDCDNILRVENTMGFINSTQVIKCVEKIGYFIEILDDNVTIPESKNDTSYISSLIHSIE